MNSHLRPISLTPILSKVAEDFVVEEFVKPAVLKKVDPNQFGTIPGSNTTQALISMLHSWNKATDGSGATVRTVLVDFKKAFDLIDHHILVDKLKSYDIPESIVFWVIDFPFLLVANNVSNLVTTAIPNGELFHLGFPRVPNSGCGYSLS